MAYQSPQHHCMQIPVRGGGGGGRREGEEAGEGEGEEGEEGKGGEGRGREERCVNGEGNVSWGRERLK